MDERSVLSSCPEKNLGVTTHHQSEHSDQPVCTCTSSMQVQNGPSPLQFTRPKAAKHHGWCFYFKEKHWHFYQPTQRSLDQAFRLCLCVQRGSTETPMQTLGKGSALLHVGTLHNGQKTPGGASARERATCSRMCTRTTKSVWTKKRWGEIFNG